MQILNGGMAGRNILRIRLRAQLRSEKGCEKNEAHSVLIVASRTVNGAIVYDIMAKNRLGPPEWLILIGGLLFIFVLWLSAWFEADIRWLHFFQAWMYFAAIGLSLRGNRWGYFIGASAAGLWD